MVPTDIAQCNTEKAKQQLITYWGIKATPLLYSIKSLNFECGTSFPHNYMHLIFENLIPNFISFWSGSFKGLDDGTIEISVNEDTWTMVGNKMAATSNYIPSIFLLSKMPNIAMNCSSFKAEQNCFWFLYVSLYILLDCLPAPIYKHYLDMVWIIKQTLTYKTMDKELDKLEQDIFNWALLPI
ncbi:hypothetical protein FRB99_006765 [Tulasnella sp. 403]|nr:hypothetical protein FRB99_006765 [Tulasnella sp. 403]